MILLGEKRVTKNFDGVTHDLCEHRAWFKPRDAKAILQASSGKCFDPIRT